MAIFLGMSAAEENDIHSENLVIRVGMKGQKRWAGNRWRARCPKKGQRQAEGDSK
jgi:hypothetical protein